MSDNVSTRAHYERVVSAMQPYVSAKSEAWKSLDWLAARIAELERERDDMHMAIQVRRPQG